MVSFWDALSQVLAKAIVFFTELFHQNSFLVLDNIVASTFEAMGYVVDRTSPISGISLPSEEQPPGFFAATMSRGIRDSWKQVSTVAIEGTETLLDAGAVIVDSVKDKFTELLAPHMADFEAAILPGSPNDPKLAEMTHTIANAFMDSLSSIEPKTQSKITYEQARTAASTYLASNVGMNLFSRGLAAGLDASHPIKKWGVDKIVDGLWWGLGLCWLTWIALGPFLQSYIAKPMSRQFRMQFSESDLTRSDVLKAYKAGNLSYDDSLVKLNYLGYDNDDSHFLLDNIHVAETDGDKQLTVSAVLKSLKLGYISEEDAANRLVSKGYSDDDTSLLIRNALHEKGDKERDLTRSQILRLYREQIINLEATQQHLRDMNYSDSEITLMIELEELRAYPSRKYLSTEKIGKYYNKGWMSQEEAYAYWAFIGWPDYEIGFLMQEYG